MATKTQTRAPAPEVSEQPRSRGEVAVFQPPRLPYHQAIEETFGVDKSRWKALVEAVYPAAKSVDAVVMALSYCKARNLDVFKRPVHIVPMWSSTANNGNGAYIETVWPGISELRTTAFRTKNYAGMDAPEFGPMKTKTFKGTIRGYQGKPDRNIEAQVKFPEWCQITVHRDLNGKVHKFVGPKVYWLEAYAKIGKTDVPNEMWQKRAIGQLEKCAEAAALRRAFPEELGNDYTAEEMEGQLMLDNGAGSAQAQIKPPSPTEPSPPEPTEVIEGEIVKEEPPDEPETTQEPEMSGAELLDWVAQRLGRITKDVIEGHPAYFGEVWEIEIEPKLDGRPKPDRDAALVIFRQHAKRLGVETNEG